MADTEPGPGPITHAVLAAGAVFVDEHDRVLLVRPSYKPYWDIPGGYVEPGESPYGACVREIGEELGIHPDIGSLLTVDWAPHPTDGDKLLFLFDGGSLTEDQVNAITLQVSELTEYRFLTLDQVRELTIPRLVRRITQTLAARRTAHPTYLEHGAPPRPASAAS